MKQLKKIEEWRKNTIEKIRLLESFKILTKKDGTPFKQFTKNFNYPIKSDGIMRCDSYIYFNKDYQVSITHTVSKSNYDDILNKTISSDRVIKEPCLLPYYHLNIEEVKEKIEFEKEKLHQYFNELKEIEEKYIYYKKIIDTWHFGDICNVLKSQQLKGTLKYLIQDYIKERLDIF